MKRLTKYENEFYQVTHTGEDVQFVVYDLCQKLGQFEDLMEKYEIESVEELETIIMLSFVLQGAFGFKDDEVKE